MIPSPSGLSKMIGSLRPPLWMNSYVKSKKYKSTQATFLVFYHSLLVISLFNLAQTGRGGPGRQ